MVFNLTYSNIFKYSILGVLTHDLELPYPNIGIVCLFVCGLTPISTSYVLHINIIDLNLNLKVELSIIYL